MLRVAVVNLKPELETPTRVSSFEFSFSKPTGRPANRKSGAECHQPALFVCE
jgi:hypothetical protein